MQEQTKKEAKAVGLEAKEGIDLTQFQIQISVEPDLTVLIQARDPSQVLILATRIVTSLKDDWHLEPKVKVFP